MTNDKALLAMCDRIIDPASAQFDDCRTVARALRERLQATDTQAIRAAALKPFADLGRELGDGVMEGIVWPDDLKIEGASAYNRGTDYFITVGDLRRAAKALSATKAEEQTT